MVDATRFSTAGRAPRPVRVPAAPEQAHEGLADTGQKRRTIVRWTGGIQVGLTGVVIQKLRRTGNSSDLFDTEPMLRGRPGQDRRSNVIDHDDVAGVEKARA